MSEDKPFDPDDTLSLEQDLDEAGSLTVDQMYEDWFLEYASYVILDRAVPYFEDGLKPVQRRIMHALNELDDGRFNKVANVIGHTMRYHPHGDAAIGDAMVNLGQKELLIDTQGNWGNVLTGDRAAAPRYIEARLSKFAKEVLFSPKITTWGISYDGRNQEPETLPVKFPLLLSQGVEGIAVGLSTKILPHNFVELCKGSIKILQGKKPKIYPDFATGGKIDVSNYTDGKRGGKVRVRATIEIADPKHLVIRDVPYGKTTGSLVDSILSANEKGKIKIKKIEDNTARDAEIVVHLASGVSPDVTLDALYAFTDCEVSISPNCCIVVDDKPVFIGVGELLEMSTMRTKELLRQELLIKEHELERKWHASSLEKIFIENRIYRDIEECETWEEVLSAIDEGLKPHITHLRFPVTEEDIVRLTEIKIKRISKFDINKAEQLLQAIEDELAEVRANIENIVEYAIGWFEHLLSTYGKGRERKTEIATFSEVDRTAVAAANVKLYVNREEGFIGTSLRRDEFVTECSDLDNIICFMADGTMMVTKVDSKTFVGKNIIHAAVWNKGDDRTIYHMIYRSGKSGPYYVKRFAVTSITRDKLYDLTAGEKNSRVEHFSANPQGEGEIVSIALKGQRLRKNEIDFNFGELAIKGRGARGNTLTKHPIRKVDVRERTGSTLAGIDIWFDETVKRLNTEERGMYLGDFSGDDRILVLNEDGTAELRNFDLSNQFQSDIAWIGKRKDDTVVSCVYFDGERELPYVKRFSATDLIDGKSTVIISEHDKSKLWFVSADTFPRIEVVFKKSGGKQRDSETIELETFMDVKGLKTLGNRLSQYDARTVKGLESLPEPEPARESDSASGAAEKQTDASGDDSADDSEQNSQNLSLF